MSDRLMSAIRIAHSESLHNIIRMDNSLKILVTVGVVRLNKDFVSWNVQMGGE